LFKFVGFHIFTCVFQIHTVQMCVSVAMQKVNRVLLLVVLQFVNLDIFSTCAVVNVTCHSDEFACEQRTCHLDADM